MSEEILAIEESTCFKASGSSESIATIVPMKIRRLQGFQVGDKLRWKAVQGSKNVTVEKVK